MTDFIEMAIVSLFSHLSDAELVEQFNNKTEEGNDNEAYEIIRRQLRVKYINDKLELL